MIYEIIFVFLLTTLLYMLLLKMTHRLYQIHLFLILTKYVNGLTYDSNPSKSKNLDFSRKNAPLGIRGPFTKIYVVTSIYV